MTIASETARSGPYTGNGATTSFAYGFKIESDDEIAVYLTEAGVDTLQTKTTHYTVTGVGSDSGGNIQFVTAPTSSQQATFIRNVPLTQLTDFSNQGGFFADTHEEAFDKIMTIAQMLNEKLDRAIIQGVSATGSQEVSDVVLEDGAVTTAKIAASAVTSAKIATDAVGSDQIATSGVGTTEIADDAVTPAKLNYNHMKPVAWGDASTSDVLSNETNLASVTYTTDTAGNGFDTYSFAFTFDSAEADANYFVFAYVNDATGGTVFAPGNITQTTNGFTVVFYHRDGVSGGDDDGFWGANYLTDISVMVCRAISAT